MKLRSHRHHTERAVAALADGSLPPEKRAEVERAVAASPDLQADLAAHREVVEAIRGAAEPAPATLRARVDGLLPPTARSPLWRTRAGRVPVLVASVLTAVAIAVVLVTSGAGPVAPTIAQAAALSGRPAQHPVAPAGPGETTLPGVSVAGLAYPSWAGPFGYQATGVRYDGVGGRLLTTVSYRHPSQGDVAYTIVSGPPLKLPGMWKSVTRDGVAFWTGWIGNRAIVTWERGGHTCVLTASHQALPTLLQLATWREGGKIPY